jgi:hypothetical protein
VPRDAELGQRDLVLQDLAAVGREPGGLRPERWGLRARSKLAEVPCDQALHLAGSHVAGHHERGVVRDVPPGKEGLHVVERGRGEVVRVPDRRPVIGMPLRIEQLSQADELHPIGTVLVVLAPLVLHHVPLVVQLGPRQGREQESHPVGLEPQDGLQVVRRHHLEVVGPIGVGAAVRRASGRLDDGECWSSPTWAEPWNSMCSKRWAKPLRPSISRPEPTWYHTFTATSGAEWSS